MTIVPVAPFKGENQRSNLYKKMRNINEPYQQMTTTEY